MQLILSFCWMPFITSLTILIAKGMWNSLCFIWFLFSRCWTFLLFKFTQILMTFIAICCRMRGYTANQINVYTIYIFCTHVYTQKNTIKIHKYLTHTPDMTTKLLHLSLYEIQREIDLLVICRNKNAPSALEIHSKTRSMRQEISSIVVLFQTNQSFLFSWLSIT